MIFTSGSTGAPKGVVVPHRSLAAFCRAAATVYELTPSDRVGHFHSVSFDAAVEEIFATLAAGATVVVRPDDVLGSTGRVLAWAATGALTVLDLPTAFWHELADHVVTGPAPLPPSVRLVITGGQAMRPAVAAAWCGAVPPSVRLLNTYGPTETTVVATAATIIAADVTTVRCRSAPPSRASSRRCATPPGPPWPTATRGNSGSPATQVALGYLGRPDLTAERFVDRDGHRWYRTGDRVRRDADARLVHLGRVDDQVKIDGHRVEPAETEHALRHHPAVREAVVVVTGDADQPSLTAHVVTRPGVTAPSTDELRRYVAARLPAAFVPTRVAVHDRLPTTPGGKPDRAALRAWAPDASVAPAPVTDTPATGAATAAPADADTTAAAAPADAAVADRAGNADRAAR